DDGLDLLAGQADQLSADESEYGPEIELDFSDLEEIPAVSARTQPDALDELDGDFIFAEEEQPAVASASGGTNLQADLEEAEFYLQQGLYDDAERLCREVLHYAPDAQECHRKLKEIAELRLAQEEQREQQPAVSSADVLTEFAFEDFDFDARLEQLQTQTLAQKKIFRTDVDEQIAADDMESHYNLGIAYREMGLLDDAISEFEKAQRDPSRFADCQMLKGLSYADKGDFDNAETIFQQALDSTQLAGDQRLNLGYELAQLYERTQRYDDALISYREVLQLDPGYRDVAEKIADLMSLLGHSAEVPVAASGEKRERISFL
ncbi:MAG: tetratricopeptide repeat protein, partial [Pelovirga sp.]